MRHRWMWLLSILVVLTLSCAGPTGIYLSYPRLGINQQIWRGNQPQIDQGHVVLVDDGPGGWPYPPNPGGEGTYWLAGHRTSHGAVFNALPGAAVGDIVYVDGATYRVTEIRQVSRVNTSEAASIILRQGVRQLIMQTSLYGDTVLFVIGQAI